MLLTDWMMPCLSGNVLAERARRLHPTLPLLLMTAAQGAEPLDLPWAAVLRKPFGVDALLDAVNAATAVASAA